MSTYEAAHGGLFPYEYEAVMKRIFDPWRTQQLDRIENLLQRSDGKQLIESEIQELQQELGGIDLATKEGAEQGAATLEPDAHQWLHGLLQAALEGDISMYRKR